MLIEFLPTDLIFSIPLDTMDFGTWFSQIYFPLVYLRTFPNIRENPGVDHEIFRIKIWILVVSVFVWATNYFGDGSRVTTEIVSASLFWAFSSPYEILPTDNLSASSCNHQISRCLHRFRSVWLHASESVGVFTFFALGVFALFVVFTDCFGDHFFTPSN